jgi:orotidine-5'-phosphate decarboxylase
MSRNFMEMLRKKWDEGKFVCVGLDSELSKIPKFLSATKGANSSIIAFNKAIIEATADLVCAYKPNSAFYEALGSGGLAILREVIRHVKSYAPDVPIILDAKRADIGNTNNGYIDALNYLGADAITVHPYLGQEALKPFLDMKDKGVIVLCRTSNSGAGEFQDLLTAAGLRVYQRVAENVATKWNGNGNCALVVGATYPEELEQVRSIVDDLPILIPGIGAQGGEVEKTVKAGRDSRGRGMIINSSRGIIFASRGEDFDKVARQKTIEMNQQIMEFNK